MHRPFIFNKVVQQVKALDGYQKSKSVESFNKQLKNITN